MNNYEYIIASLPSEDGLSVPKGFDYEEIISFIRANCSKRDCRLIDALEFGMLKKGSASTHFHRYISKSSSRFLRRWFALDRKLRLMKVDYVKGVHTEAQDEEQKRILEIFAIGNLYERERSIDLYMWKAAEEFTLTNLFDIDLILSFVARALIVKRWSSLDEATGKALFKHLVDEIRGTFKGVEWNA